MDILSLGTLPCVGTINLIRTLKKNHSSKFGF